jgi:signal transduction histidine kinase/ligand-binding sensor domain-containing protein/AraC-like DNA-binding protein
MLNMYRITNGTEISASWGLKALKNILSLVLLLLFMNLMPLDASNQTLDKYDNAIFKRLDISNGLSQSLIAAICQDSLGRMWFGTKDGLNLYDGYKFTVFKHDPFDPGTISDSHIKSIYTDARGRLWIGTLDGGLNLYNEETGKFTRFTHNQNNPGTISNNNVQAIVGDSHGNIWIGTSGSGINKLTKSSGGPGKGESEFSISRYTGLIEGLNLDELEVYCLYIDRYNILWAGTSQCVLAMDLNTGDNRFVKVSNLGEENTFLQADDFDNMPGGRSIFEDQSGELWLANRHGLYTYNRHQKIFIPYHLSGGRRNIKNIQAALSYINNGKEEIWLTSRDTLFVIDKNSGNFKALLHDKNRNNSLQRGNLIKLFADISGSMWIGSNGYGVSLHDPSTMKFLYPNDISSGSVATRFSSRDLSIRCFYETFLPTGPLWIGATGGLFRIDRKNSRIEKINLEPNFNSSELSVYSISGDKDGIIWIGCSMGLVRYDPITGHSRFIPTGLYVSEQHHESRVAKVHLAENNLWILTPNTIGILNSPENTFTHYRFNELPLNSNREMVYPSLYEDPNGNFWIGTPTGLRYFNTTTREMQSFVNDPGNIKSLSHNDVRAIVADPHRPEDFLWLATAGGGISRLDLREKTFTSFTEKNGLSNNTVYGIICDYAGTIWASTNRGLSRFNVITETFTNYSAADGLQSNEFNSGAFYQSSRGEIFFGGINGYNNFFPSGVTQKKFLPPVIITSFELLTRPGNASPKQFHNIAATERLVLDHNQNHFSVAFAALDYSASGESRYAYSLATEGESWIELGSNRTLTFTDLKSGTYKLRIRGTNGDGIWSNKEASLVIEITPPWWQKDWAYMTFILVFLFLIALSRNYELSRIKLRNRIKIANIEARKLKEINQVKSQFFANISHEFRTPLTLIKGPVEQLIEETDDPGRREMLAVMHNQANRLLNLINQLLDLSKLESGQYSLRPSSGDISAYLKGLVMSFASLAESKGIKLKYTESLPPSQPQSENHEEFYFDRDVFQKIVINLLSNAIKFTDSPGKIDVRVAQSEPTPGTKQLIIEVEDSGIGISEEHLVHIYDRFYQVDPASDRALEGSGIGLAYTKELIDLHKGTISVQSETGVGTLFTLKFPYGSDPYREFGIYDCPEDNEENAHTVSYSVVSDTESPDHTSDKDNVKGLKEKPLILVVEDHVDVRNYICRNLRNFYQLVEASGGTEGIRLAINTIPDLIISDVMMPGQNGLRLCEVLKSNEKTSHIPIMLLTARASDGDRIQGLETGADTYLTKPFNIRELQARVKNLIESRRIMREKFSSNALIKPGEISVSSRDQVFMGKVVQIIEDNLDKEGFSVDELAGKAGMSLSQLHRKLKSLINLSANQLIRSIRMQRAKELIEKDAGTISEISFMVGYADPGYFTKAFKTYYGFLPSDIQNKKQSALEK